MESINRIVLSRMKFIGDVVLTTPLVRALRDAYPHAHIAYMGEKEAVSLLRHNPHLDEILPYDFSRNDIVEQLRMIVALRKRRFDLFIDLFSNPRSALLAYASGAPMRIGKEVKGRGKLYTHTIDDDGTPKTAVEFHYRYLRPLGVEPKHVRTEIFLTEEERREARIFLKWQEVVPDRPIIALHPGATWPAKRWPPERFADLTDLINARLDAQVVITQGPGDAGVVAEVSRRAVGNVTVLPLMPLRQLAAVLSHAACYIANDNGTMHIAAALGIPTLGIFGPGEENIWFPYVPPYYHASAGHCALRRDVPCHPCHLDLCNRAGEEYMECMKLLSAKDVFKEVAHRMRVPV